MNGEHEQIKLWTQVVAGMELDGSAVRLLDAKRWNDCRTRLTAFGTGFAE